MKPPPPFWIATPSGWKLVPLMKGVQVWALTIHVCTLELAPYGVQRLQVLLHGRSETSGCTELWVHTCIPKRCNIYLIAPVWVQTCFLRCNIAPYRVLVLYRYGCKNAPLYISVYGSPFNTHLCLSSSSISCLSSSCQIWRVQQMGPSRSGKFHGTHSGPRWRLPSFGNLFGKGIAYFCKL